MEGSKFDGHWNESNVWRPMGNCLVWWPMEGSKLGALGMFHVWLFLEGEKEASFSPPFIFHPIRFYLNLFSIDYGVLFYHGSRPLLHVFPSFSLTYKLQSCILKYQVFQTFIVKLILIEDIFLSLKSWHSTRLCLMSLKLNKWMKNRLKNLP